MKWDIACDASINGKAKRDNGDEIWLIVDRDTATISYEISDRGVGERSVGPRGPVARVVVPDTDEDGNPILTTMKTVDVGTIEKFDDWRPSVPRIVVEEVTTLDELESDLTEECDKTALVDDFQSFLDYP